MSPLLFSVVHIEGGITISQPLFDHHLLQAARWLDKGEEERNGIVE